MSEEFIQKKPILGMRQLFLTMADVDATFAESFAEGNLPWQQHSASERVREIKRGIVSTLIILLAQKTNGYAKIRNKLEDTLQAVHAQIS